MDCVATVPSLTMPAPRAALPLARATISLVNPTRPPSTLFPGHFSKPTLPAQCSQRPLTGTPPLALTRPQVASPHCTLYSRQPSLSPWLSSPKRRGSLPQQTRRHVCWCSASARGASASSDDSDSDSEGARNETAGGRSAEWMGDEREVEIASKLIAQWKKEKKGEGKASSGSSGVPAPPPQQVLLQAVSDLSRMEGREAKTTNVVMGGTAATDYGDDWLELDKKVNTYPSWRAFTAIGTGGEDFVESMVGAVESVMDDRIPKWQVSARESAKGRYVSVKIGPIRLESSDQVRAIYEAMKKDQRMRYFL